jgi:hypothetical protein
MTVKVCDVGATLAVAQEGIAQTGQGQALPLQQRNNGYVSDQSDTKQEEKK